MNRRYDLDWLRVIAFGILMLFHTGMGFTSNEWHVKNYESSRLLDELISFLHQWRMPLLFFISGAAVWFALEKYSTWRYFSERQKRLLLPLFFGMLVVIPPQVYCERVYQRQGYASFLDFYATLFTGGTYPQGNLSWHHLWYIPYIWAFSMVTLPFFVWCRSVRGRAVLAGFQSLLTRPGRLYLLFVPSAIVEILLRPYYPGDACNLVSDWANFAHKLTFFIIGFCLANQIDLADTIAQKRRRFLVMAVASLIAIEIVWQTHLQLPRALYRCLSNFHIWMWILAALGYGRRYLNFNSPALRYATDAVYPFYILHQTVIVALLLPLVPVDLGLWTKYCLVLTGTFLVTWALYQWLIVRVDWLRVCFGMKPRRRREQASASAALGVPASPGSPPEGLAIRSQSGSATPALLLSVCAVLLPLNAMPASKLLPAAIPAESLAGNRLGISPSQPAAVYLPPSYATSDKRFPVIYWLPNFNTPVWRYTAGNYQGFRLREALDRLLRAGAIPEVIVVIPNAMHFLGSSWYRNSATTGRWDDFITRELVAYMDTHFRTIPHRESRALTGHGVGGTGALELALKHPDRFGSVFALSPALLTGEDLRAFAARADAQAVDWQARVEEWGHLAPASGSRAFRLYLQARLNPPSRDAMFDGLRISCAAATAEPTDRYPYFSFPSPPTHDEAERAGFWGTIMGNWDDKLKAYLARPERLRRITIECGREGEYDFIRRGVEHVSRLMSSLGLTNTMTISDGNHDSTLGRRLETGMLPALASTLMTE